MKSHRDVCSVRSYSVLDEASTRSQLTVPKQDRDPVTVILGFESNLFFFIILNFYNSSETGRKGLGIGLPTSMSSPLGFRVRQTPRAKEGRASVHCCDSLCTECLPPKRCSEINIFTNTHKIATTLMLLAYLLQHVA